MTTRKLIAYVIVFLLFFVVACRTTEPAPTEAPKLKSAAPTVSPTATSAAVIETDVPVSGGVLNVALDAMPNHLNPAIQSGTLTGLPGAQLFTSLLRIDRDWQYHPNLAESWEIAPDGLSTTFTLRRDATFHDGEPVTAEDVAFSIETVRDYHPFSAMLAAVERVETPNPYTVVVHLTQPHPALLQVAASPMLPIIPKHVYGDGQDLRTHPANWDVVGSGPFQLAQVTDSEIVLDRNPNYFRPGQPYLDQVVFKITTTESVPVAIEAGNIDLWSFNDNLIVNEQLTQTGQVKVDYDGYGGIGGLKWLAFNLQAPPFDNVLVRKAFAYAIDREFLVETLFRGASKAATGPIAPDTPFYSDQVELYPTNAELANQLLDDAGYPRDDSGLRFKTTLLVPPDATFGPEIADYFRADLLKKLGVDIEIVLTKDFSVWADQVSNGEFSLTIDEVFNWGEPVIGVHRTYDSQNIRPGVIWSNTQGYRSETVDSLMARAATATDFETRYQLYEDFQQQVVEDLPVYWIARSPYATIYNQDLRGLSNNIWGAMFPYDEAFWVE